MFAQANKPKNKYERVMPVPSVGEINRKEASLTEIVDKIEMVEKHMSKYAHDKLLSQSQEYKNQKTDVVKILNPNAFIFEVFKYIDKYGYTFDLWKFDIKKMRNIDLAGAGDFTIGKLGNALSEKLKTYSEQDINIQISRYRGDEFMVLIPEKNSAGEIIDKQEIINDFTAEIQKISAESYDIRKRSCRKKLRYPFLHL